MIAISRIEAVAFWVRALESLPWFRIKWADRHAGALPSEDDEEVFIDEYVRCTRDLTP